MEFERTCRLFGGVIWCLFAVLTTGISSVAVPFSVNCVEANWTHASSKCELVDQKDVLDVANSDRIPNLAWIDTSKPYSQWAHYLGCFIFKKGKIRYTTHSLESKNPLLFCLEVCSASRYIALRNNQCACFEWEMRHSPISSNKVVRICNSVACILDGTSLCAHSSENNNTFALYEKAFLSQDFIKVPGNCLSVTIENTMAFRVIQCNETLPYICNQAVYEPKNWTNAFKKCNKPFGIENIGLNIASPGKYFTSYTRHLEEGTKTVGYPEYCLAVNVGEGGHMTMHYRKCSDQLPSLCTNKESVQIEDTCVTTNQSSSKSDMTVNVSVGLSVTVVFIIVVSIFVILHCVRKRNKTPIVGDNGPQEQGEVYAVVKKKSRWSVTYSVEFE